ncbi:unnamed protein product [Adineta steineri]|uniref:Uncharacterized protein n=1 Tax=Adineta steineri TaxID=433720 RepID=A0A815PEU7_9BILA|nr:unnamed protein product [Adineta steineri]CAF1447962.1 unnamed protein product [Adineta steineri]CAF1629674.1 unnamed protein product [Adineta steineri]
MHFFRLKPRYQPQRQSSHIVDQIDLPVIARRRTLQLPPTSIAPPQFKTRIWHLLPFVGKNTNECLFILG